MLKYSKKQYVLLVCCICHFLKQTNLIIFLSLNFEFVISKELKLCQKRA